MFKKLLSVDSRSASGSGAGGGKATLIANDTSISGVMRVVGDARIEGSFEGSIEVSGTLRITKSARVVCEYIKAETVIVSGAVKSDIIASRVEIRKTGQIFGNLETDSLGTEEGGYVRGTVELREQIDTE